MMTKKQKGQELKIKKTQESQRGTYTYEFANGDKVELIPGENGITELDIKKLHALDDSEVYYNLKNLRPKRTEEEKEKIELEKTLFIEKFEAEYGYEPEKSIIDEHINTVFPRNYCLSLDAELVNQDKSSIENKIIRQEKFEWSERVEKAFESLNTKQKEALIDKYLNELTQKEISKELNVSNAAVSKLVARALKKFKENY